MRICVCTVHLKVNIADVEYVVLLQLFMCFLFLCILMVFIVPVIVPHLYLVFNMWVEHPELLSSFLIFVFASISWAFYLKTDLLRIYVFIQACSFETNIYKREHLEAISKLIFM
jgi:hypothetical protein